MGEKETCPDCGSSYSRIRQHWSMTDCGGDHSSKKTLSCGYCGDEFEEWTYRVENGDGKYCSSDCRDKDKRQGKSVECDWCGGETYVPPSRIKNNKHYFCDRECSSKWRSDRFSGDGHPRWNGGKVESTCEECGEGYEITPALQDKTRFCSWTCKQNNWADDPETRECANCGHKVTRQPRNFKGEEAVCSEECYKEWWSEQQRGSGNPAWKGGKSGVTAVRRMIGAQSWDKTAREVRKGAGHVCQKCGKFQPHRRLSAHHIIPVASGGTNGHWNLMALCESCHGEVEEYTKSFTEPHLLKPRP